MALRTMALFTILSTTRAVADTSELWLEWQGLGTDAREVSLAPGQSAVVEFYFRMR